MSNIKRTTYLVNETVLEKSTEQSIEMEMNLPDYCADISSVLQCFVFPNIISGAISNNTISIEGNALVRVLYLSEGEIYSYEQSCSFSKEIEHDSQTVGAVLDMKTAVEYVNCRAANSRKLEIRSAFALLVKMSACKQKDVIESIEDAHIQVDKDCVSACSAVGNTSTVVSLSQVLDIGSDKPTIRSILRNTALPVIEQTKQVSGKVLVKGELRLKTLYKSEKGSVEYIENTLPISQILDIDGVDENSTVDIKLTLGSLDITAKPSALGNMSLLDINAAVQINACCYNCIDFPVLKDAYSTDFASECSFKSVTVDKILNQLSNHYMHTMLLENSAQIKKVVDVWCDDIRCTASYEEGRLALSGTVKAYVLYEDDRGTLNLKQGENTFSFYENVANVSAVKCEPNAAILGTDYLLKDNGLEIRMNIGINAIVFESESRRVVEDITLSEVPAHQKSALFLYYAKKGESIWGIARKYHTTVALIQGENGLEEDFITADQPLLIWS